MKKRLLALILAGVLLVGSAGAAFTATKTYASGQFTDVAANAWYAASVKKVYELNLMNGSSATTFNPTGMFTVAEALTVAARMHHMDNGGNGQLPAAAGAWYQSAVNYCVQNKLITKDQFDSYTRSATRAEMAGVIRAALPDDRWKAINSVTALPDVNMCNDYAQAIFDLYNAGVFTGNDDYGMFQPYAYITRAEVAAIVARCADPAQRKTLNLKPLSQRQAPELTGGYQRDYTRMSNGRLAYKDPNTQKWGYLDGNGNIVIPAQYDKAEGFASGYAVVKVSDIYNDYKDGLINTAGKVVLPLDYSHITRLGDGIYRVGAALWNNGRFVTQSEYRYSDIYSMGDGMYGVTKSGSGRGVINSSGKVIVPCQYSYSSDLNWSGIYGYGYNGEKRGYDVYDANGTKLIEGTMRPVKGNPLLSMKEGNKYAVAVGSKKITEAVYDGVELVEGSSFAQVKYGNQVGLVGLSGELVAPGVYEKYIFEGDYFAAYKQGGGEYSMWDKFAGKEDDRSYEVVIGDATGVLHRATCDTLDGYDFTLTVNEESGTFFVRTDEGYRADSGVFFQKNGTSRNVMNYGSYFAWKEEFGGYIMNKSGQVFGPRYAYYLEHYYEDRTEWEDEDGRHTESSYGIWDATGELSKPIYNSLDEVNAAYKEYQEEQDKAKEEQDKEFYSRPENKKYEIRTNDAGKPIVCYGNDTTGWTPVIEFYKNNMYYDEIKDIGEGYYACRFNTTWYLLHA